jgi:hypothetical protein
MFKIAALAVGMADVLFLALFALDAFAPGIPLIQQVVGFAMHLLPNAVLALALAIAWRWPLAGGLTLFALATLPYFVLSNPFWVNTLLAGPVAVSAGLFILSDWWTARYRPPQF